MKHHKLYVLIFTLVFIAFAALFLFFPRSTFSETERRELKPFPTFTFDSLKSGDFTKGVSEWFSDTEPYRDFFMTAHLILKDFTGWRSKDPDAITIHEKKEPATDEPVAEDNGEINQFEVLEGADAKAKIADRGIIVVGAAPTARALMIYGGVGGGDSFAEAANTYKEVFGDKMNVYVMVIPNSTEYYLPDRVKNKSKSMYTTVVSVHEKLRNVKPVDVYTILGQHAKEEIFLRTDHHWSPLGAYYAAQKFAQVAGVPFRDLTSYDRHVVHGFVGTMYGYSKDIAIKNSPEDFVYYTPRNIDYSTEYVNYTVDRNMNITHEAAPSAGPFFYEHKDGSSAAYSTFMGGDMKITKVSTGTKNGRRLMIIKDSFGNALPGYLFYSFEQIHVIDGRYFNKNMRDYVRSNGITDILLAANVFRAYSSSSGKSIIKMLDRKDASSSSHSKYSEIDSRKSNNRQNKKREKESKVTPTMQPTE